LVYIVARYELWMRWYTNQCMCRAPPYMGKVRWLLVIWGGFGGGKDDSEEGVEAFIVQLLGNEMEMPGRQARAAMIQHGWSNGESYEELRSDQVSEL
jgi:hypothetical protein